jgi:hypothetical protein
MRVIEGCELHTMLPTEWHFQKLKVVVVVTRAAGWMEVNRSSIGSRDELVENHCSVWGWLVKVGVTRRRKA